MDKMYFINIKNFCSVKDPIKKMEKKKPTDWEKMFASHSPDKRLEYIKIAQNSMIKLKQTNQKVVERYVEFFH